MTSSDPSTHRSPARRPAARRASARLPLIVLGEGGILLPWLDAPTRGELAVPGRVGVTVYGPGTVAGAVAAGYARSFARLLDTREATVWASPRSQFTAPQFGRHERRLSSSLPEWAVEFRSGSQTCLVGVGRRPRHGRPQTAEVWLAPEGHACARAPGEAHERWVPVGLPVQP